MADFGRNTVSLDRRLADDAHRAARPGWVYVLTNPAMPGLVKVGMTTRDPASRMAELTAATGVPAPFVMAWCRAVSDCAFIEGTVHRMLADRRVSGRREFFRCDVARARQVIEAAAGAKLGRPYRVRARAMHATRRWRRGDGLALSLLAGVTTLLLLLFAHPSVDWLPRPAAQIAAAVEQLHSEGTEYLK